MYHPRPGKGSPPMFNICGYTLTVIFFPGSSISKESACNAGDRGLISWLRKSPGGGYVNPLQYSCLENPMDRGAWQAAVCGIARVRHDFATKPLTVMEASQVPWW